MYSIPNLHGIKTEGQLSRRVLIQEDITETDNNGIHITGNGIAGFFAVIVLAFPVIIVVGLMDSIFVNTKLVEKPLLVGKIDY